MATPFQPQSLMPQGPSPQDAALAAAFLGQPLPGNAPAKTPDRFSDDRALLAFAESRKHDASQYRWVYERSWWRNILYMLGRQWIYYDSTRGQWVDKRLAKWIPRPVTNKCAEVHQSIMSVFESVELVTKVRPGGNDPADISTAEIADKLEPMIQNEHQMERNRRLADFWLIATGNVFLHTWWDKYADAGDVLLHFNECPSCGHVYPEVEGQDAAQAVPLIIQASQMGTPPPTMVCPKCQQPHPDENAEEAQETYATGRGSTDVISPFEMLLPPGLTDFRHADYVIRMRWRSKTWVEKNYPEAATRIKFSKGSNDRSMQLYRAIASQSDIANSPFALMAGTDAEQGEGTTEYELNHKPTREYPEGLFMRWMGDAAAVVIRDEGQSLPGPLPYKTKRGNLLFPWVHIPYERFGGKVWGRSPLDLIIQKQDQINQIDSLIQLIVQRTANPIWLEPKGAEVQKFTGEPGLVVKYNPLIAGGNAKPERIQGENVPGSVIQIRNQLVSDIEALAGTYDVLRGAKPAGVEAFSAMQLLVERSQSRFAMPLAERGEGYRQWFHYALELERAYGAEDRFVTAMGPNGRWQLLHFKNADLTGSVQIVIEDGSQAPKTNLGKRAAIQQLQQLQILNPQDPDQQFAILKAFGQTDLLPALDADVKSALQEQDDLEQWALTLAEMPPAPPQMVPGPMGPVPLAPQGPPFPMSAEKWHNHAVHISEHRKWALSDTGRSLMSKLPQMRPGFEQHLAAHEMMAMATAAGMPAFAPPPPTAGVGGAMAMANSNQESGNPADVPSGAGLGAQGRGPE